MSISEINLPPPTRYDSPEVENKAVLLQDSDHRAAIRAELDLKLLVTHHLPNYQ